MDKFTQNNSFTQWLSPINQKQHLSIKKFYGQSEQAVHNQVYVAIEK